MIRILPNHFSISCMQSDFHNWLLKYLPKFIFSVHNCQIHKKSVTEVFKQLLSRAGRQADKKSSVQGWSSFTDPHKCQDLSGGQVVERVSQEREQKTKLSCPGWCTGWWQQWIPLGWQGAAGAQAQELETNAGLTQGHLQLRRHTDGSSVVSRLLSAARRPPRNYFAETLLSTSQETRLCLQLYDTGCICKSFDDMDDLSKGGFIGLRSRKRSFWNPLG